MPPVHLTHRIDLALLLVWRATQAKFGRWITLIYTCLCLATGVNAQGLSSTTRRSGSVDYVNPYIGNISHLLVPTYPTVHLPNSMMRVYPQRGSFTSEYLAGLPIIVTGHRGGSAFNLRPFDGDANNPNLLTRYNYDLEKTTPYKYSVYLDDCQTDVAFAPSHKSAIYTFSYGNTSTHYLLLSTRDGELKVQGNAVSGYQRLGGSTKVYLYMLLSARPEKSGAFENNVARYGVNAASGREAALLLSFGPANSRLAVRYGVSYISTEQARKNLGEEIGDSNLDKVAATGRAIWNQALGKIAVMGGSDNDKTIFYTALYRDYERMVNISEDGQYYNAFDGQVHSDNGVSFYTDDWSWDTYRALHPLHVLINPQQEAAKVASYVRMAEADKDGWVPTFPGINGDGHAMNGKHFAAIIWDAYSKGLRGFDLATAYAHCKKTFMEETLAPWMRAPAGSLDQFYQDKGYFPALKPGEAETATPVSGGERRQAVAVTLAASYDDWCLAQMAKALGKTDDYNFFLKQSYNYRNLFNKATGFFHPKAADGNFIEPFDYRFSGGMGTRDYYDENNGWTYRWDVPHNIGDLVQLMGGPQKFIENLDQLYNEDLGKSRYEFYAQLPDNTGNVGQFSMGNEPSMHIPYLYNYAGAPWKTQKRVRSLLEMWFRNDLMGVPGDEDGGGLSAFVVFSAIGFYPVTPGSLSYNIGSPLFKRVTLDLGGGRKFIVNAPNCSRDNKYIQSARLNGQDWNKPWFSHRDIINGGTLELVMSNHPNKSWGAAPEAAPPSAGPEVL
ncbi:MAG: GH92 family glycosyl hydrolase [Abitibacteriaceae bacterium]|nr:GH92 family glycosyl hydrolase [Abditibacteriaceae bacterium]